MAIELLDNTKKKKIIADLNEDYGITNLPYLLIKTGKEKIRGYSGDLSREELNNIAKSLRVELIGSQLLTVYDEHGRINFDALNLPIIKSQINKSILTLNKESELKDWLSGKNIEMNLHELNIKNPFVLIKNDKNDFLGLGKNRGSFLQNYLPKERRIK